MVPEIENYLQKKDFRAEQDRIADKDAGKETEEELALMGTNLYNVGDPRVEVHAGQAGAKLSLKPELKSSRFLADSPTELSSATVVKRCELYNN